MFTTRRVLQTIVTLDFGETKVTIGRDLYGARLTEGGDGTTSKATVALLPLKNCLGMYKDSSCDNSFGFSAVVSSALTSLPKISCLLTRDMPDPPPPFPPRPPPSPPPGFIIDPNLCYVGGSAHFIIAPHKVAAQAALQTWVVSVHLNQWLPGLRIVLDFPGVMHAEHGLHVHSVRPADVARLVSMTRHSAIVELLNTAAREFEFEALGDVDEVRVVCDVGDARPPPPPRPAPPSHPIQVSLWDGKRADGRAGSPPGRSADQLIDGAHQMPPPPTISPPSPPAPPSEKPEPGPWGALISIGLMLYIGYHAYHLHQNPEPYMIGAATMVRSLRTKATQTPRGRKYLQKVSTNAIGRQVLQLEARYLGIGANAVADAEAGVPPVPLALKAKSVKAKAKDRKEADPKEAQALVPKARSDDDADDDDSDEDGPADDDVFEFGGEDIDESPKTELVITLATGKTRRRDVDLSAVKDLKELQQIVAKVCRSVGADPKGGLRMQYRDSGGTMATVSKSTRIRDICRSAELHLAPKSAASSSSVSSSGGSSRESGRAPPRITSDDLE